MLQKRYEHDKDGKQLQEFINTAVADDIVEKGSREDTLNAFFAPKSPQQAMSLFNFLRMHITLESNGMGVSLRENRHGISELLEKEGFDYEIVKTFINDFENKLMSNHYNKQKEKQDNK